MTTGYPRRQAQRGGDDPFWILAATIYVVALALAGLPWIAVGYIAQYYLQRWLHWRLSFLLWVVLLFLGAYMLYTSYPHSGLAPLYQREVADYIHAAEHDQLDLARWPIRQLWADTWPVWLRTWQGIGIAGFAAELFANRNDTVRTLRRNEQHRIGRGQRLQRRARRRTNRPTHIPDEVGGMMVVGIPINDDNEEA